MNTQRIEPKDPVHEENGQWYFWNEIWTDRLGPYKSEEEARRQLKAYGEYINTGEPPVSYE